MKHRKVTCTLPFCEGNHECRGFLRGCDGGRVEGGTAVPPALSKVCCACFPSEHYYVFIEVLIFTGMVVVAAVYKIMQKQQVRKGKVD